VLLVLPYVAYTARRTAATISSLCGTQAASSDRLKGIGVLRPATISIGHCLLGDDDVLGLAHRVQDEFRVERHQRPGVDHLDFDAVPGEDVGRRQRLRHHARPGDQRGVRAGAFHVGPAQFDHVIAGGHGPLGHVELLVLDEDDGIVVPHGALQQPLGVEGRGGGGDLEAGDVAEDGLEALRVLGGQAVADASLCAQHHRHVPAPAGHEAVLGGLVAELVQDQQGEVDEQYLHHRPHAGDGRPDSGAGEAGLADRRVQDAQRPELLQQPHRHLVGAAALSDALAHEEDGRVAPHLLAQRLVQGLAIHQRARFGGAHQ